MVKPKCHTILLPTSLFLDGDKLEIKFTFPGESYREYWQLYIQTIWHILSCYCNLGKFLHLQKFPKWLWNALYFDLVILTTFVALTIVGHNYFTAMLFFCQFLQNESFTNTEVWWLFPELIFNAKFITLMPIPYNTVNNMRMQILTQNDLKHVYTPPDH